VPRVVPGGDGEPWQPVDGVMPTGRDTVVGGAVVTPAWLAALLHPVTTRVRATAMATAAVALPAHVVMALASRSRGGVP
jgi:hypothetical protein